MPDGTTQPVYPTTNLFGVYDESFKWKPDGTYAPVVWRSKDNYDVDTNGVGRIIQNGNKLFFTGGDWDFTPCELFCILY